jgi:site-specific DNA-methyltransferase (adenine-specific)
MKSKSAENTASGLMANRMTNPTHRMTDLKPYYADDWATIYCGDCRTILPSLGRFDLCLTDPPYGIFACGGKWGRKSELLWDREPANNIEQVVSCATHCVIWGGNYFQLPPSRGWLVWHKRDSVPSAADAELAWTSRDANTILIDCTIAQTNPERAGHPTQKPLKVMVWCVSLFPDAQSIIDPFMGSGTTLVAAKQLGRKAVGIEIEERYCEIAAKRLSQSYLPLNTEPHTPQLSQPTIL